MSLCDTLGWWTKVRRPSLLALYRDKDNLFFFSARDHGHTMTESHMCNLMKENVHHLALGRHAHLREDN